MAIVKAFKAHRPHNTKAQEIVCVPYDVIDTKDALKLAAGKPNSFLHVIRPEIDLPEGTDLYSEEVYQKGKENLNKLLNSENYTQDEKAHLYLYRQIWNGRAQTGIYACVSTEEYNTNKILKHELTRTDKENDRTKHILTQSAHAEPVMLAYDDTAGLTTLMEIEQQQDPIYDFTTDDEVQHTIWRVREANEIIEAFKNIKALYIADGHHRCASAARVAQKKAQNNANHTGNEEYNFFPAVLFPMQQMEILAYNRIIINVPENFKAQINKKFQLEVVKNPVPAKKGDICIYLDEKWYGLSLPKSAKDDVASKLDVSRLQEFILEPYLGITNQRTDENIDFVGGIKGTKELERLVDTGQASLAISMYPTDIKDLIAVSDANLLMPPKSTWFEPKLRSGFLVHTF